MILIPKMRLKRLLCLGVVVIVTFLGLRFVVRAITGYSREQLILSLRQLSTKEVVRPGEVTVIQGPAKSKGCQNMGTPHHALFMIITSPENLEQRQAIRSILKKYVTPWEQRIIENSGGYQIGSTIRALFFVGRTTDGSKITVLDLIQEAKEYGDMIVDNFFESYLHLTIKTLRMLKWVEANCPKVPFLIKIDDDVYINGTAIFDFLHNIESKSDLTINQHSGGTDNQYYHHPGQDLIAGYKYVKIDQDNDPMSKWYTPSSVWNSGPLPDFVSGICYILGSRARSLLYRLALNTKLFHLEDVFLTGIVRDELEGQDGGYSLDLVNIPGIQIWFPLTQRLKMDCSGIQNISLLHPMSVSELLCYHQIRSCDKNWLIHWC